MDRAGMDRDMMSFFARLSARLSRRSRRPRTAPATSDPQPAPQPPPPQEPPVETAQEVRADRERAPPRRRVRAVGIDLGTTFSSISYIEKGHATVIQNNAGIEITPSVVHFGEGEVLVGEEAVKIRRDSSKTTIYNIKRVMGRRVDDAFLQGRSWPFEIVQGNNGKAAVRVGDAIHTPEQISSEILKYMRRISVKILSAEPTDAVITVPANFSNAQREATRDAGTLAGLNVLQIVNEPTAAAIAFSAQHRDNESKRRVLVFDLGGGTFDVSIVEIDGNQRRVLGTDGLPTLGGADFDQRIYEDAKTRLLEQGIRITGVDWTLMEACECAKKALSSRDTATISHIRHRGAGFELRRSAFNDLCEDLFEKTIAVVDRDDVDEVLLVGGSTRIPRVREMLEDRFTKQKIRDDIEPELAVAKGAAILAHSLMRQAGVDDEEEADGPSRPRTSSSSSSSSSSNSSSSESDDDDSFSFITLLDVAPFNLGLRLDGDRFKILIPRNTPIPFTTYPTFLTNVMDNDEKLEIEIMEGNFAQASANDTLAKVEIEIPPKPAGKNNVKVLLSIDASGILSVTAVDMHTNKEVSVTFRSERVDERIEERPRADSDPSLSELFRGELGDIRMLAQILARMHADRRNRLDSSDED